MDNDNKATPPLPMFVEIRRQKDHDQDRSQSLLEAYVVVLDDPKHCKPWLKHLSHTLPLGNSNPSANFFGPLTNRNITRNNTRYNSCNSSSSISSNNHTKPDLSHLKRVRNQQRNQRVSSNSITGGKVEHRPQQQHHKESQPIESPTRKKKKRQESLQVLLRDVQSMEQDFQLLFSASSSASNNDDAKAITTATSCVEYIQQVLSQALLPSVMSSMKIQKQWVPGRPPVSHVEWQDFNNNYWPTMLRQEQFQEHLEAQRKLTQEELDQMKLGMEFAIADMQEMIHSMVKDNGERHRVVLVSGAIVFDPRENQVVSRGHEERQEQQLCAIDRYNPLATSIILAIQGVSRRERRKAIETQGGMSSEEFQTGQYLCNNYDLYCTHEPTVFEAMALLHSRIRRVVFGFGTSRGGGLRTKHVHALPSTNHNYRAFGGQTGSDIWTRIQRSVLIHDEKDPRDNRDER